MENLEHANEKAVLLMASAFLALQKAIDFSDDYFVNFEAKDKGFYFEIKTNYLVSSYQPPFDNPEGAVDPIDVWDCEKVDVPKKATLKEYAKIMYGVLLNIQSVPFNSDL